MGYQFYLSATQVIGGVADQFTVNIKIQNNRVVPFITIGKLGLLNCSYLES